MDQGDITTLAGTSVSPRPGLGAAPRKSIAGAWGTAICLSVSVGVLPEGSPLASAEPTVSVQRDVREPPARQVSSAASRILARYQDAAGGAAVARVRTLQITGRYSAPTAARPSGTVSASFLAPDYFDQRTVFQTASGHSYSIRATLAGGKAWVSGMKLVMPLAADPAMRHAREAFISFMLGVLPGRLVTDAVVAAGAVTRDTDARPLDCLSVEVRDVPVRAVCFDTKSGLPAEVRYWNRDGYGNRDVVRFSDYRPVDGVMLPGEVRYVYAGSVGRVFEAVSYVVNPLLTPAMFRQDVVH